MKQVVDNIVVQAQGVDNEQILMQARHEIVMYYAYGIFDNVELEAHNGTLTVTGQVTICYILKVSAAPSRSTLGSGTNVEPILLIDDDVELCSMLSDYLSRHGYHVTLAHDGKSGLTKALGGSYCITLLDVMLPGLDGFEVLRRLRAAASSMSVLLLTARGDDVDRIVGLEIGADDVMQERQREHG